MLKVEYSTLFKQKKMKKGGNFDQGALLDFLQPSVAV